MFYLLCHEPVSGEDKISREGLSVMIPHSRVVSTGLQGVKFMAETRTRRVQIRYRKTEYKCLYDKALKQGLTISEYIRNLTIEDCKK